MNVKRSPSGIIARRTLLDTVCDEQVEIRLWSPEPGPDPTKEWRCRVEIAAKQESRAQLVGYGIDSLQALVNGICALRQWFEGKFMRFQWLSERNGEIGIPGVIVSSDPDVLALTEQLIQAEASRQVLLRKYVMQYLGRSDVRAVRQKKKSTATARVAAATGHDKSKTKRRKKRAKK